MTEVQKFPLSLATTPQFLERSFLLFDVEMVTGDAPL